MLIGVMMWLAASGLFFRFMMEQCRQAAREGYLDELAYLREQQAAD